MSYFRKGLNISVKPEKEKQIIDFVYRVNGEEHSIKRLGIRKKREYVDDYIIIGEMNRLIIIPNTLKYQGWMRLREIKKMTKRIMKGAKK